MRNPDEIALLDGKVRILRSTGGLDPTTDTILVAAACPVHAHDTVLDLGCGSGAAGLCVLYREPQAHLTGIDIQEAPLTLARHSAALNGWQEQARFLHADICDFRPEKEGRFDHVICNPPYLENGAHTPPPDAGRAAAVGGSSLKDWTDAAFYALKPQGSLSLIHRADMLDRVVHSLGKRFGAIEIFPIWPGHGKPANRVILRARKDRRSPATLHPGLILHEAGRRYTPAAERILRDGRELLDP